MFFLVIVTITLCLIQLGFHFWQMDFYKLMKLYNWLIIPAINKSVLLGPILSNKICLINDNNETESSQSMCLRNQ